MEVLTSRTIIHPSDLDRSLDFYGNRLGLAVAREFGDGDDRGVVFSAGGGFIEVVSHDHQMPDDDRCPRVTLWLQVRDVAVTVSELGRRGVAIVRPPATEPWGLIEAWIDDPDGIRIHLVEVPPDHPLRRDARLTEPGTQPRA